MAQHLFTFLKETSKHSLPFGVGPDEEHHMGCRASKVSSGAGKPHWLQQEKESQTWDSPKNVSPGGRLDEVSWWQAQHLPQGQSSGFTPLESHIPRLLELGGTSAKCCLLQIRTQDIRR